MEIEVFPLKSFLIYIDWLSWMIRFCNHRHRFYLVNLHFGNYEAPWMGNCRTQYRIDWSNGIVPFLDR